MPQVKSVAALVMVATGSRYETEENNGVTHFLEHMVFKGTKKRPTSLEISSLLDSIGAAWNAFTAKEYTGFYIKASAEHLGLMLDVLSDNLLNSLIDPAEVERERGVINEEINMYEDQPSERVGEVFEQLLYDNNPLAMRVLGSKDSLKRIDREQLRGYLGRRYHSTSIVVGIAGKIDAKVNGGYHSSMAIDKEGVGLVKEYFADVKRGAENHFDGAKDTQSGPGLLIQHKKTDQAHICLGVRAYPRLHPDRYVLSVLSTILGGNMSSRLFTEVREKRGLAYTVHAGAEEFADCGYLVAQAGLRLNAVDEAVKVILDQFALLSAKPVSQKELKQAKDFARGKMILALEDSFRVASFYTASELLEGRMETPEEILERIGKVTVEDVQRVAGDLFRSRKLNLAMIGPFKEEGRFAKLLKL